MDETDALTNTFSEEGRIHQVEYAIKSISSAGASLGLCFKNGVVLLGKNTETNTTLIPDEKIYNINDNVYAVVGGLYADSNVLVNYARLKAQEFLEEYDQPMSPWMVAKTIARIQQDFTQKGGMRPFGVALLIAGYDTVRGYRLFSTDPSGTPVEWTAHAFGEGEKTIVAALDTPDLSAPMDAAIARAFKALSSASEGQTNEQAIACTILYTNEEGKHCVRTMKTPEIAEALRAAKNE
ncbi:20S proteasome subunit alpha 3 [Nematocida homosporus]|uniref:20S proteasome subunit alpha 3 n=1 Tax=Nematocida homosporus TaxID=1912981 RepID=UPI002220DC7B|nr:20S proteasome subunit alpha 3 [Nematocida homosporus]KAI5184968.1 20S proteasome subunit alpha 3 [Nematocida homosporus]